MPIIIAKLLSSTNFSPGNASITTAIVVTLRTSGIEHEPSLIVTKSFTFRAYLRA